MKNMIHFKKAVRRACCLLLALVMTLSLTVQAFAAWPATGVTNANNYLRAGTLKGTNVPAKHMSIGGFIELYMVNEGSGAAAYTMTPTSIDFGDLKASKNNKADLVMNKAYDFSTPVPYNITAEDGRTAPVFALAVEGTTDAWTDAEKQEMLSYAELMANTFHNICTTANTIASAKTEVGSYHPANADMLEELGYWLGMFTYFDPDDSDATMNGNRLFDSYEDKWQAGGEAAVEFMEEYLTKWMTRNKAWIFKPSAVKTVYEKIVPWYIEYALNTRIAEPMLTWVSIGGSVGTIDAENGTVTVPLPKGTDTAKLTVKVTEADGCVAKSVAGSVEQGSMAYTVTPYDPAFGAKYTTLARTWKIEITEGTPRNEVTSFAVIVDGVTRYAKIDETAKTITLNLPEGTDMSAITPVITHTGTASTMDSGSFDFSGSDTTPLKLTVSNSNFGLSTDYSVTITANKSAEKRILSYKLGDAVGAVGDDVVTIEIPYAADLSALTPEIEISEFATLSAPESLIVGDNAYTVTAEDGTTRTYTVTITRAAVATGNQITEFAYGSVKGTIDQALGTITMELPAGSSTTFAPTIKLSPFATVSPASGVEQDFSNPVKYEVTAQNGATNTYTVTVTVSAVQAENPWKDKMTSLVDKTISRYRTEATDDWEYMNIGFYDKKLNNMNAATIAERIAKLDSTTNVAMTNLDRKIMTLTACGIDCSNLARYNDGQPFVDKSGNEIDNLVEILYNYTGGYTINGPIFALIALDMGNYTIPENAVWTREALLEKILNHVYLSDGFGLDMVTMLMQSIAPYYDDPVYGARVKAKLEEGLKIVLDSFGDKNVFKNPYGVQWGGVYTSEGSSQIVCAMSAMGVDCHTDPRMSNGTQSALTALLDYADFEAGYFAHDSTTPKNAMGTYQGTYATQWYLGFLNNGGAGHPYSLYYQRFDFSRKLSTEADIKSFTLEGKIGQITEGGENGRNTITVTLPKGMPLTDLTPELTLSDGAILKAPSLPTDFFEGVEQPFTVQAEDGKTTKTYYVVVKLSDEEKPSGAELYTDTIALKDANILRDLDILGKNITTTASGTDIELEVNAGVDTSNLMLSARISYGATATPALDGEKGMDFTDWKTFTITSGDGEVTRTYRIRVTPRTQASIAAFSVTVGGTVYNGTIDNAKNTITVSGVDDSALTSTTLEPDITLGESTKVCTPASGLPQDFSRPVQYTVAGDEKVVSRTYTVSVLNRSGGYITATGGGSSGGDTPAPATARITAFSVLGVDGVIDNTANTITVTLPAGTDVTAVAPVVTVPSGAVVSPVSSQVVNLTAPVTYTVTLGDESRSYTVTVEFLRSISQQLWDGVAEESDVADHQVSRDPHGLKGGWTG